MIKGLRKVTETDMLKNWALAEVMSTRRQKYLNDQLPLALLEKIKQEELHFSDKEWGQLINFIRIARAPLLDGLVPLNIRWYEGQFSIEDIKSLQIMNWEPFVNLADSRNLKDLAQAFLDGKMPDQHHEFAENLNRIKNSFRVAEMHGKPICVSKREGGPYILIEGFTRLSALLMNVLEGNTKEVGSVPIILGISKDIHRWKFA